MLSSKSRKGAIRRLLDLLFHEVQWTVGLIAPDAFWRALAAGHFADKDVRWLKIPGEMFLTDPCWLSEEKGLFVAERLHFRDRTGRLVLCKLTKRKVNVVRELDLPPGHFSYPMVYDLDGRQMIIPESAAFDRVAGIVVDQRGDIQDETVLIDGRKLVDPTVISIDGRYWLFANPFDNWNHELVILSAPQIGGPWTEAAYSPLKIENCRSAGKPMKRDGKLYWPTQYNSDRYGGGLVMRTIDEISDSGLSHQLAGTILPDPRGKFPLGVHTVAEGKDRYLIDGARTTFRPTKPLDVLISRVKRRKSGRGHG